MPCQKESIVGQDIERPPAGRIESYYWILAYANVSQRRVVGVFSSLADYVKRRKSKRDPVRKCCESTVSDTVRCENIRIASLALGLCSANERTQIPRSVLHWNDLRETARVWNFFLNGKHSLVLHPPFSDNTLAVGVDLATETVYGGNPFVREPLRQLPWKLLRLCKKIQCNSMNLPTCHS